MAHFEPVYEVFDVMLVGSFDVIFSIRDAFLFGVISFGAIESLFYVVCIYSVMSLAVLVLCVVYAS